MSFEKTTFPCFLAHTICPIADGLKPVILVGFGAEGFIACLVMTTVYSSGRYELFKTRKAKLRLDEVRIYRTRDNVVDFCKKSSNFSSESRHLSYLGKCPISPDLISSIKKFSVLKREEERLKKQIGNILSVEEFPRQLL